MRDLPGMMLHLNIVLLTSPEHALRSLMKSRVRVAIDPNFGSEYPLRPGLSQDCDPNCKGTPRNTPKYAGMPIL